jgi:hypothetical protein
MHWATSIVSKLREIDREESPHGLYGLRHARKTGERLPKLSSILIGPSIRIVQRIGGALHPGSRFSDSVSFGIKEPRTINIRFSSYADTKVRKFGNEYRLDSKTKVAHEPVPDFGSEVPKLAEAARGYYGKLDCARSFGILFIGHFQKERDSVALLEKAISPKFIERYGLSHTHTAWEDIHGRGFISMIHLWYIEQPENKTEPNQAPQTTTTAVTDRAVARSAPAAVVSDL